MRKHNLYLTQVVQSPTTTNNSAYRPLKGRSRNHTHYRSTTLMPNSKHVLLSVDLKCSKLWNRRLSFSFVACTAAKCEGFVLQVNPVLPLNYAMHDIRSCRCIVKVCSLHNIQLESYREQEHIIFLILHPLLLVCYQTGSLSVRKQSNIMWTWLWHQRQVSEGD